MSASPANESAIQPFRDDSVTPAIRGFLHTPAKKRGGGLVLAHSAGSNANSRLLIAVAETFSLEGFAVLRCDLPFRQVRSYGGPGRGDAARDRAGLKNAVDAMRKIAQGQVFLGGHSSGGRQSTMLCADEPGLAHGLLLMSYPLHPPRKPAELRIQHLPKLKTPSLFFHGTRDPFGSIDEMQKALALIPGKTRLVEMEAAGHDLGFDKKGASRELPEKIMKIFGEFFGNLHTSSR
jgi:uncharacterized protein